MSNYSNRPRVLFVTPEVAFLPERKGRRTTFILANSGGFGDFQAELITDMFELGADVHVAQPDFRNIFAVSCRKENSGVNGKLPGDRVHLAEDRAIFYSKPLNSNSVWENIKISLAFQREVINQILPRVQPDLIHCYDWMTGLIPAAAKKFEIPCLFTIKKLDTARSLLSCVEDIGIDAAGFWQNLFYERFPGCYEQTRDSNPLDLLLSGILAASHVNTASAVPLPNFADGPSDYIDSPLRQVLAQKWKAGYACQIPGPPQLNLNPTSNKKLHCRYMPKDPHAGKPKNDRAKRQSIPSSVKRPTAQCYIDLYETILQRPLVASEPKKVWPINKKSGINIQAMSQRKALGIKPYALSNEKVSTAAMAPI
jgi:starch synthase/alpha-amylase